MHRRVWREREGLFLLEGPVVVDDAVAAGLSLRDVFVLADDETVVPIAHRCEAAGARVFEVGQNVLRAVADAVSPQAIVAVAEMPNFSLQQLAAEADLVLVLAQVRDPGNAGTLTRSAAAAGVDCVVFTRGSVDPFGPKTVRASAGGVFKVPVDRSAELRDALDALRARGFRAVGAESGHSTTIYDLDLTTKIALVVGNEAWGFGGSASMGLDGIASIPMAGNVESLNVAAAGAIFLFEAVRQRRLSSAPHG